VARRGRICIPARIISVLSSQDGWAAGAAVTSGVTAAVWTAVVGIVTLEVAAGSRARLRPQGLCVQAGAGAVMGLAIIALKLMLH
jgi:hypothetical protein